MLCGKLTAARTPLDGTRIAFVSTRDGDDAVYVMNGDGSGLTLLADVGAAIGAADFVWSPAP